MAMLNGVRVFGLVSGLAAGITYVSKRSNSAQMVELSSKEVLNRHSSEIKSKGVTCAVNLKYTRVISAAEELTNLCMLKYGAPGCIVAVSVDGKLVWSRGFGFSDVENSITCTPDTVMRIASISKSLTSVAVAKLWEEGTLDLDCSVQEYVPSFPQKTFQEEPVSITTRQLLTHMGCIRHYKKLHEKEVEGVGDGRYREFHSTKLYKTVTDALKLFAGDDLLCKPGKKFLYTTHGWTLISAVIEGASGKSYLDYMKDSVLDPLELRCVWADHHAPLIRRRSKHYRMDKTLQNAPYVDNSLKWAGGGLLSNAEDLVYFGNSLLSMYQGNTNQAKTLLKPSTVKKMWSPVVKANLKNYHYGWGWYVSSPQGGGDDPKVLMHTGGAVGATSVLLIRPSAHHHKDQLPIDSPSSGPHGVVVAVLFNLEGVRDVHKLAVSIADVFS